MTHGGLGLRPCCYCCTHSTTNLRITRRELGRRCTHFTLSMSLQISYAKAVLVGVTAWSRRTWVQGRGRAKEGNLRAKDLNSGDQGATVQVRMSWVASQWERVSWSSEPRCELRCIMCTDNRLLKISRLPANLAVPLGVDGRHIAPEGTHQCTNLLGNLSKSVWIPKNNTRLNNV
jgi:hypothetical protein